MDSRPPETDSALKRFIVQVNFYHRCIPRVAELLVTLYGILPSARKNVRKLRWIDTLIEDSSIVNGAIGTAILLYHLNSDSKLILMTNDANIADHALDSIKFTDRLPFQMQEQNPAPMRNASNAKNICSPRT